MSTQVREIFCNRCGLRNAADRSTCSGCGAPLDHADDDPTALHDAVVPAGPPGNEATPHRTGTPCLLVTGGPGAGSRFGLGDGTTSLGRDPRNDVFLDDVTVSRRHAEIRRRSSHVAIRDVGSFNGTYLNGARIETDAVLSDGDDLRIGRFRVVFLEF